MYSRRMRSPVEEKISSARMSAGSYARPRLSPSPQSARSHRSSSSPPKSAQVSFDRSSTGFPEVEDKRAIPSDYSTGHSNISRRTSPSPRDCRPYVSTRTSPSPRDRKPCVNAQDQTTYQSSSIPLKNAGPPLEGVHPERERFKDRMKKGNHTKSSEALYNSAEKITESEIHSKRGSGNTDIYYGGQTDSDDDQLPAHRNRIGRSRERKPKYNQEEMQTMASYAKAHGTNFSRQIQQQKAYQLKQGKVPEDVSKAEMDEVKKILQEQRGSSDDFVHPETERESSPERQHKMDWQFLRDSNDSEVFGLSMIKNENPSTVLNWLKATDDDISNQVAVSEGRTISLLQAMIKKNNAVSRDSTSSLQDDFVPRERVMEAERRSSIAEEQIRQFEELIKAAEGGYGDDQLRALLSRSKSMERHFNHLKKFADDKHSELKRLHSIQDKDILKGGSPQGGGTAEKIKKEIQEHANHKKRLMQVYKMYLEVLQFLKFEHSKRMEAETKTQLLTSQIKRHSAALKKAEKVIKDSALSPIMPKDASSPRGLNTSECRNSSSFPSGFHSPRTALSRNPSPEPGIVLSNSELIAQNHRKEFEELENALIQEGRSKGFADVDLYSEKKTIGKRDTCWEYKHVHLDFVRSNHAKDPSAERCLEASNSPSTRRALSPKQSGAAIFNERHGFTLEDVGSPRAMSTSEHDHRHFDRARAPAGHYFQQLREKPSSFKSIGSSSDLASSSFKSIGSSFMSDRTCSIEETEDQTMEKSIVGHTPWKFPANMNESSQMEICQDSDGNQCQMTTLVSVDALEDEAWENVAHDALNEMWVNVTDNGMLSRIRSHADEGEAREVNDDQVSRNSNDAKAINHQLGRDVSRPSDFQEEMSVVESGQVQQTLREQRYEMTNSKRISIPLSSVKLCRQGSVQ
ncbi:hypothetical protein KP509_18G076900 [Ceratopteris richardii]|uniref:Uncharacterized protein n=2 Tax=Ceratopteris richardii TaxID=49495 RepID=A0A8T2SUW0_CERRI|nr:hypothetical protein KP509_18G076900 [Ceratopteris richardii]